jgi:HEAT repeat protein
VVVRNIKLYPPGSKAIVTANRQMKEVIDEFLAKNELLSFFGIRQALIVNGQKIDVSEFKYFAESFLKFMGRLELKGITFKRGLTEEELQVLLEAFGRVKADMIDQQFWQRFAAEQRLVNIDLSQVRYTVIADSESEVQTDQAVFEEAAVTPAEISAQLEDAEQGLDASDLKDLPEVLRSLLNAARSIKLYPLQSKAITAAIGHLLQSLQRILVRKPALTLARVSTALLVNGERIDISEFETLAQSFLKFLNSLALTSLTFLAKVSAEELQGFIGSLAELPAQDLDGAYWKQLARERGFSSILFDQRLYEARVAATRLTPTETRTVKKTAKIVTEVQPTEGESAEVKPVETLDALAGKMPVRLSDLLLKGDDDHIKKIVNGLLQQFLQGPLQTRQKVVNRFHNMVEGLNISLQNQLAKLITGPLLIVFAKEDDPIILRELANLLHRLTTVLLQFGEYPTASQIFLHLHRRQRELVEAKGEQANLLQKILLKPLEPKAQQLVLQDFRSKELSRRQDAAKLLGNLRGVALPLLVKIVKNEEDFRVRQMAAALLAEHGVLAAKLVKRELALQATADERRRILEVIDTITNDLKTELAYALADENDQVHLAAVQLAERLDQDQVGKLLLEQTENPKVHVAVAAIKLLGKLKPPTANEKLVSIMQSAKNEEVVVACCQSIGLIANSASIEPLAKLLASKGFLRRQRHSADVRATAALALAQINHPRVAAVLANYANDNDPRVRQIANSFKLASTTPPKRNLAVAK